MSTDAMHHLNKLLITLAVLGHSAAAFADDAADAVKRGTAAMKAGRIHEACGAFEAATKLDDKTETQLLLADCYAQDARPASAAKLYRALAESDSNAARRKASLAKASKLEARAPKLRLAISPTPTPAGTIVKVDGVEVPASGDILVDQGPHEVTATAPGFEGHASAPVDRDRAILDVIVRMEAVAAPEPAPMASTAAPAPARTKAPARTADAEPTGAAAMMVDEAPTSHRKRNGIILAAGGGAVIVGAGVLFGLAASKFSDERDLCPDKTCASPDDVARADQLAKDGRTLRGISYGMGIGGLALVGAGIYLIATGHPHASHVALRLEPGYQGVGYTARW